MANNLERSFIFMKLCAKIEFVFLDIHICPPRATIPHIWGLFLTHISALSGTNRLLINESIYHGKQPK
jgi:hypothetical protein